MSHDRAAARLMAMHAMRWAGVALVMFGILVVCGRVAFPRQLGYVLVIVGLIDALVVPAMLARRWRSPPR
jgi:hypothetical protein